jgi:hypothetical protein
MEDDFGTGPFAGAPNPHKVSSIDVRMVEEDLR